MEGVGETDVKGDGQTSYRQEISFVSFSQNFYQLKTAFLFSLETVLPLVHQPLLLSCAAIPLITLCLLKIQVVK